MLLCKKDHGRPLLIYKLLITIFFIPFSMFAKTIECYYIAKSEVYPGPAAVQCPDSFGHYKNGPMKVDILLKYIKVYAFDDKTKAIKRDGFS